MERIEDNDEDLQYCMTDKKRKMGNLGSETGSNEALCCEYISTILHASLIIAKRITKKKITLKPEFEVTGDEATGRVDYAIKKSDLTNGYMQNIMQLDSLYHTKMRKRKASEAFNNKFDYFYGVVNTAMDWHFIMYTPEKIYCVKEDYHLPLTEDILKDDRGLLQNLKKVMGRIEVLALMCLFLVTNSLHKLCNTLWHTITTFTD
ncbi:14686_t:CDS:2 [Entrophospora sp. SA101]|nr:14686_t:CDS:2 [Entrophospora sp. SA101]